MFVAGTVLVGIETGVQNNVYFIVAGAVLAIVGIAIGIALYTSGSTPDSSSSSSRLFSSPPP